MRLFLILFVFLNAPVFAENVKASSIQKVATLGGVDDELNGPISIVNIRVDSDPGYKNLKLEDHQSFLQLVLPQTFVPLPGNFIDATTPYIKKIAIYQNPPHEAVIRFFIEKKISTQKFLEASNVGVLGNRVVLQIDHAKLGIVEAAEDTAHALASLPVKSTEVLSEKNSFLSNVDNTLKQAAIVSLFFIILLLGALTIKRFLRNYNLNKGALPLQDMQVLNQLVIGPRLKLLLLQIESEKILLSASHDKVEILGRFSKYQAPSFAPRSQRETQGAQTGDVSKAVSFENMIRDKSIEKQAAKIEIPEKPLTRDVDHTIDSVTQLIRNKLKTLPTKV